MNKYEALKIRQILDNPDLSNNERMWEVSLLVDEALEQPAQEPVAWLYKREKYSGDWYVVTNYEKENDSGSQNIEAYDIPLYTHPHQWQGLTDDEIQELTHYDIKFARAIEQSLREKNT